MITKLVEKKKQKKQNSMYEIKKKSFVNYAKKSIHSKAAQTRINNYCIT